MSTISIKRLPLVCPEALLSLEDSLFGDQAPCRDFVCRYVDMWPRHFERIHTAVTSGHQADAMNAALSLHGSSMMVGATRLGALASELIRSLEDGQHGIAAEKLTTLRLCGEETTGQLTASYINVA